MEQEKLVHNPMPVTLPVGENGWYCTVCMDKKKTREELDGKECGGLPPLGFSVGDKAPVTRDGMKG